MKGGEGGIEKRKIEREGRGERKVKKDRRGDDNGNHMNIMRPHNMTKRHPMTVT